MAKPSQLRRNASMGARGVLSSRPAGGAFQTRWSHGGYGRDALFDAVARRCTRELSRRVMPNPVCGPLGPVVSGNVGLTTNVVRCAIGTLRRSACTGVAAFGGAAARSAERWLAAHGRAKSATGPWHARLTNVFVVHATKKLLDRCGGVSPLDTPSTARLGDWYATALFWRASSGAFRERDNTAAGVRSPRSCQHARAPVR